MIVPAGGGKYKVKSKKGKNLSTAVTMAVAKKRLAQIEYFKHKGGE